MPTGSSTWRPPTHSCFAVLALVILVVSSVVPLVVVPSAARAASPAPETSSPTVLFDNFTNDTALDTSQWLINGPAGVAYGQDDVGAGTTVITLQPDFSSAGMEIAQVNDKGEAGTIQSNSSFSPPFNATATVEATVSNGHTFGFAVASADASSGVTIYGNLNPANCSHLEYCGIPDICGIPANSSIPPGQCFYGMDAKTGSGGGGWSDLPKLYLMPSVDVAYTLEINITASGTADYSVSQGGDVLGRSSVEVGTGPFYVILEQAEGGPVSQPGANVAYWQSVSVNAFPTCSAPLAPQAARSASPKDPSSKCVPVYPTEPSLPTVNLDYSGTPMSSPIKVHAVKDQYFPQGLGVLFRVPGTKKYTNTLEVQPSPSGASTIMLNVTLNCVTAKCDQPGGTQLPTSYSLKISATGTGYTQNIVMQLQLSKAKWLVMLYCASDRSLEGYIYANVGEIKRASGANDNPAVGMLVLFYSVYGERSLRSGGQPANTIALYEIANGTITPVGGIWPETDIFDPATLHKFLVTAMAMIPADRNQLLLADHGNGMQGFGGDPKYMPVTGLATALSGISPKLEILSFDACYMGQLEVLYQLSSYANYFTASERAVPGEGYDYTGFMTSLLKNPDQSTAAYLNVIMSTFLVKYMTDYYQNPRSFVDKVIPTLAAINSSQLGGVVSGLNTLSLALAKDYATKSMVFNTTMAQVLTSTVGAKTQVFPRVVRNYGPYFDIRSFAQNILNSPEITDLSVRIAANALVEDLKAAVIANTTTTLMYEGLTVLLIPAFYVSGPYADVFTGIETGLSFNAAANWLPLLQDIVHSIPPSSTSSTVVTLTHPGHQLYLSVYNSTGGHTGYNPAIVNFTGWGIETMPGTYYLDFGNGTAFIVLPSSMQSFTTVVDGTAMEEASENYTLTYTVIQNGTVTSTKTVQGIINQDTLQSANVTVQSGFLAVGPTTITGSTASITSSITTTAISTAPTTPSVASTSSTTSTTSSSTSTSFTTPAASSSSAASSSFTTSSSSTGGSLTTVYASVGVAVAIVVVAVAVLARRRAK